MNTRVRNLNKLRTENTITVPAISVMKRNFLKGRIGLKLSTGYGFKSITAELEDTIACDEHKQDVFTLTKTMENREIKNELGVTDSGYPTATQAVASLISRIKMWDEGKEGHGLIQKGFYDTSGYENAIYAKCKDGSIVAVYCHWFTKYDEWRICCSSVIEIGIWDEGRRFSCLS